MSPCGSISQPYRSVLKCLHISSYASFYSVWTMPLSSSLVSHHIPVHVNHAAGPSTFTPMPMIWYTRCHIAFFPSIWATGYCVCLFYLGVFKWEDLLQDENSKELQRPKNAGPFPLYHPVRDWQHNCMSQFRMQLLGPFETKIVHSIKSLPSMDLMSMSGYANVLSILLL